MNILLLIVIIIGLALQSISKKEYDRKVGGGECTFSAFSALPALIYCLVAAKGKFDFSPTFIPYAVAFSIFYSCTILFTLLAIKEGPLSLTVLITSYSLLLPAFYGCVVWGEMLTLCGFFGIILLAASVYFINISKSVSSKNEYRKLSPKWYIYVIIAFLGNGGCSIVQREQQLKCSGLYKSEFMITAYVISAILLFTAALVLERKDIKKYIKKGFVWWSISGLFNALSNLTVMNLALVVSATVLYPVVSAGSILLTVMFSVAVYKEKLVTRQRLGVFLGVLAVIMLNL